MMHQEVAERVRPPLNHERYLNREFTWLEFNWRVLHEAMDERTPLLERLTFLAIVGSNLDEFFMKRVGGLQRQIDADVRSLSIDGRTPREQLRIIREVIVQMVRQQRHCLLDVLLPRMRELDLHLLRYEELDETEQEHVQGYFRQSIFPVLTPLAVDPGHPFPFLSNLSLSLAVRLWDPGDGEQHYARVKIPGNVPRWVPLLRPGRWVPVEEVIAHNLEDLFPGTTILEAHPFRITRNADMQRNEEEADDLLDMIEEELRHRRFGAVVRLEAAEAMSPELCQWLSNSLDVSQEDIYRVPGPLRLSDLRDLKPVDLPAGYYAPALSSTHPLLRHLDAGELDRDFFQVIRESDILVHHPYQAFGTSVLRFLETAASDRKVLSIKQTLYRTDKNSPIIAALVKAAGNGKQVAVLVEITARFDEANNIEWVKVLENAGVHVSYGLVGLKTHTKTLLVVREDSDGLRCYCHIGTGNYHTGTARLYTDLGLFTCDMEIGQDLVYLFNYLTGRSRFDDYTRLLVAPVNMRKRYLEMIEREIGHTKQGREGRIIAKMNSLEDREIIEALYEASNAGVQIDLIVRGFCCLRPGVPGMSENIRVQSVIGRFLEHSRIFYFANDGQPVYYIGSADWMFRNLDRRMECAVPIDDAKLQLRLYRILNAYLEDKRQSWDMQPDGSYVQRTTGTPREETGIQELMMADEGPR